MCITFWNGENKYILTCVVLAAGKASSAHTRFGGLLVDRTLSQHALLRVAGSEIATRRGGADAADSGPDQTIR